jgi:CRP/FNR family cyclic AMP-dependent transcriptional regulator
MAAQPNLLNYLGHYRETQRFQPGTVVFERGQLGNRAYIVASGSVEIRVGSTVLEVVEPGGLFGEVSLLDGSPRGVTAIARGACELVPLDERRFMFLVAQMPMFALDVMRSLARRVRVLNRAPKKRSLS